MAHKTIAPTTELKELEIPHPAQLAIPFLAFRNMSCAQHREHRVRLTAVGARRPCPGEVETDPGGRVD